MGRYRDLDIKDIVIIYCDGEPDYDFPIWVVKVENDGTNPDDEILTTHPYWHFDDEKFLTLRPVYKRKQLYAIPRDMRFKSIKKHIEECLQPLKTVGELQYSSVPPLYVDVSDEL